MWQPVMYRTNTGRTTYNDARADLAPAIFARFTRDSCMTTLRGTTLARILKAVPSKRGALVRSFHSAIALLLGQVPGALLLLTLKGLSIAILLPVVGLLW